MSYSKITRKKLIDEFGLTFKTKSLFPDEIFSVMPSEHLTVDLEEAVAHALNNEKALSEFYITPILKEVWRITGKRFKIHSGDHLDVDEKRGLSGPCDFIFSADPEDFEIDSPIISIVEAKKENFDAGVTLGAAQLFASSIFNKNKGIVTSELWGCTANGWNWLFFKLIEDKQIIIHNNYFTKDDLPKLLGTWKIVIETALQQISKP